MTTVRIGDHYAVIQGHAGYGPLGSDIVCAGVSTLAQTMAECLLRQEKEGGVSHVQIKLLPGDVEMRWEGEAQCLPTIMTGFECLSESYGEYVKFKREQS